MRALFVFSLFNIQTAPLSKTSSQSLSYLDNLLSMSLFISVSRVLMISLSFPTFEFPDLGPVCLFLGFLHLRFSVLLSTTVHLWKSCFFFNSSFFRILRYLSVFFWTTWLCLVCLSVLSIGETIPPCLLSVFYPFAFSIFDFEFLLSCCYPLVHCFLLSISLSLLTPLLNLSLSTSPDFLWVPSMFLVLSSHFLNLQLTPFISTRPNTIVPHDTDSPVPFSKCPSSLSKYANKLAWVGISGLCILVSHPPC